MKTSVAELARLRPSSASEHLDCSWSLDSVMLCSREKHEQSAALSRLPFGCCIERWKDNNTIVEVARARGRAGGLKTRDHVATRVPRHAHWQVVVEDTGTVPFLSWLMLISS